MSIKSRDRLAVAKLCPICYANNCNIILECGFESCSNCLRLWLLENIILNTVNEEDDDIKASAKCMDDQCDHRLYKKEAQLLLSPSEFESVCEKYLFFYLANQKDISKCPTPNCDYAGVILLKSCKDDLICDKCNKHWREKAQQGFFGRGLLELDLLEDGKFISYLKKVLFTKVCPSCGITIEKISGCPIMTCGCCKTEFCWLCLCRTQSHQHLDWLVMDPIVMLFYWPSIIFFIFSVCIHLGYIYPLVLTIVFAILYYTALAIVSGIFLLLWAVQIDLWRRILLMGYQRPPGEKFYSIIYMLCSSAFLSLGIFFHGFIRALLVIHLIAAGCLTIVILVVVVYRCCRKTFLNRQNYHPQLDEENPPHQAGQENPIQPQVEAKEAEVDAPASIPKRERSLLRKENKHNRKSKSKKSKSKKRMKSTKGTEGRVSHKHKEKKSKRSRGEYA